MPLLTSQFRSARASCGCSAGTARCRAASARVASHRQLGRQSGRPGGCFFDWQGAMGKRCAARGSNPYLNIGDSQVFRPMVRLHRRQQVRRRRRQRALANPSAPRARFLRRQQLLGRVSVRVDAAVLLRPRRSDTRVHTRRQASWQARRGTRRCRTCSSPSFEAVAPIPPTPLHSTSAAHTNRSCSSAHPSPHRQQYGTTSPSRSRGGPPDHLASQQYGRG